jgi:Ca2+-dependent lipid-binding protein
MFKKKHLNFFFSILFNSKPNSRLLRVRVVEAKDLNKDLFGSSDPFVQVALCKKLNDTNIIGVVRTQTLKKNTNPVYNADFVFNVLPSEHKLVIDLYHENRIVRFNLYTQAYAYFSK